MILNKRSLELVDFSGRKSEGVKKTLSLLLLSFIAL